MVFCNAYKVYRDAVDTFSADKTIEIESPPFTDACEPIYRLKRLSEVLSFQKR